MTPSNSSSFKHDYAVLLTCRGSSRDDLVMRGWYFLNFKNQTKPVLNYRYDFELSKQIFKFSWQIGASSKNTPLIKCVYTWDGPKEVLLTVLDLSVWKEWIYPDYKNESELSGIFVTKEHLPFPEAQLNFWFLSPVVPDAFKEVQGLSEPVGVVIFPNNHVVAAAGRHVNDSRDVFVGEEREREEPPLDRELLCGHDKAHVQPLLVFTPILCERLKEASCVQ